MSCVCLSYTQHTNIPICPHCFWWTSNWMWNFEYQIPKYKIWIHSLTGRHTFVCVHGWHEMEMPNSVWNFNVWLPVNLIHVYPHFCFSLSWNIWLLANDFRYNHLQRQTKEEKKNDDKASDNEISDAFKIKGKKPEENQIKTTITNADFVSFPYSCYCVLTVQKV